MSIPLAKQIALIMVDMQPTFLHSIEDSECITARCRFALETAGLFGIQVIFTEQSPQKLGNTDSTLLDRAPHGTVFSKTTFSAFGAVGLPEKLEDEGIQHLLLAGIETPICIYNTAIHAQAHELETTLLQDCIGARRTSDEQSVIQFLLQKSDCNILPSETIFYSLLNDATNPLFRDFTKLVKKHDTHSR